jgi:S-adenosylmethionine:tRNA ribosyltransferase-isomerase
MPRIRADGLSHMRLSDFDYELPPELVAQEPLPDRAASRMLVVYRQHQRWEDRAFRDLPEFLGSGDCLVLNDSRVLPARLLGRRAGVRARPIGKKNPARKQYLKGQVEVLLLRPSAEDPAVWQALVHPGRKMRPGERVIFDDGLEAEILRWGPFGERTIRLHCDGDLFDKLERIGHVPLPPYIRRPDRPEDRERYQTVYARKPGSVAAPTAGLHFTPEILERCRQAGAEVAWVTLHVGLGTFQPVRADPIEQQKLHSEPFEISEENAARLRAARRLVAVGTTSVRVLETAVRTHGLAAMRGETDLFIYPGFEFRATGALLTNFHLPRSSLLMLVCAFAGREFTLAAYRHAVRQRYRFYSYGDCMLLV